MEHMLTRLQWLVGEEKIKTLQGKKVLLFWMRWSRLLCPRSIGSFWRRAYNYCRW